MEVSADPQAQVASPERMEPQDPLQRRQSVLFGEEKSFSPLPGLQHRKIRIFKLNKDRPT
jgi:hypothetical protein